MICLLYPRLQQYVQLHRPEQPSITYRFEFLNEANIYIKIHQLSKNLGFVLAQLFCLRNSLLCPSLQKRVSPKSLIGLEFSSH